MPRVPRVPWAPGAPGAVRAKTTNRSASGALVMNRLAPEMTQSSPSRTALVLRPEGSEPASGSVSANDATAPPASRGSHAACCSWVPASARTFPAMPLLMPNIERNAGVVYPSSRASCTSWVSDAARPPYSSGSV